MPHTFNPDHAPALDHPLRRLLMPAKPLLHRIGLAAGHAFLDVGAGSGYYAFPALSVVGLPGRVIAVDCEPRMIAKLHAGARALEASNFEAFLGGAEHPGVPRETADVALMSMVLHEVEGKGTAIASLFQALKSGGTLGIIEFEPGRFAFGPPNRERIGREELRSLLGGAGFGEFEAAGIGFSLYLATARKP